MPALENIFPPTNMASFGDDKTTMRPAAPNTHGERFDQVMSRALSPQKPNAAPTQNRQQANFSGAQKRNSASSIPALTPVNAADDSATAATDLSAPVKIRDGLKPDDVGSKAADAALPMAAVTASDGSQTISILLLAPTLAACFLKSFAPAAVPNSAADNPAAAAVLPAGADEKNGETQVATVPGVAATAKQAVADALSRLETDASQKLATKSSSPQNISVKKADVKIAGVSAVVPNISGLAGADDAAPKKAEAVLVGDSVREDSGNPDVSPNLPAESALFTPAKSHGTSVAKQDVPMKNAEQTNKVAGLAGSGEKVLPGDALPVARENILPGRDSSIPVSARVMPLETSVATISAAQNNPVRSAVSADEAAAVSNSSDLRSQALDRTHDLMTLHATRLAGANSDSLQVVIKPDAGTQLSLELRQRGGGIEAQAVLLKGDFENLKQHWPELQQRLEQRGIKLAPLTSDGNSATWSGNQGFKNQPEQSAERESFLAGAIAGFVPAGAKNNLPEEPAIQAASSRGWQTWA